MGGFGIPLTGLTPPHVNFQHHLSWSLLCSVSSGKIRGDYSLCWYWWNLLPSLFKLSFHNWGLQNSKLFYFKDIWNFLKTLFISKTIVLSYGYIGTCVSMATNHWPGNKDITWLSNIQLLYSIYTNFRHKIKTTSIP
jgi:hypothetical protein